MTKRQGIDEKWEGMPECVIERPDLDPVLNKLDPNLNKHITFAKGEVAILREEYALALMYFSDPCLKREGNYRAAFYEGYAHLMHLASLQQLSEEEYVYVLLNILEAFSGFFLPEDIDFLLKTLETGFEKGFFVRPHVLPLGFFDTGDVNCIIYEFILCCDRDERKRLFARLYEEVSKELPSPLK